MYKLKDNWACKVIILPVVKYIYWILLNGKPTLSLSLSHILSYKCHLTDRSVVSIHICKILSLLFQYRFKRRYHRFLIPFSSLSQSISHPAAFGFPLQGVGGGEAAHSQGGGMKQVALSGLDWGWNGNRTNVTRVPRICFNQVWLRQADTEMTVKKDKVYSQFPFRNRRNGGSHRATGEAPGLVGR